MTYFRRWRTSALVLGLLFAGCSSTITGVPQTSGSPAPPVVLGRGTLAVINRHNPNAKKVWIFPPHSETFTREITFPGSRFDPNSLAFDRRGDLYIGYNDTSGSGEYGVTEVNVQSLNIVRQIHGLPQWPNGSVAVDDQNYLYVNTKSLIGGDVKIYRPNAETKPAIEIKDHHTPMTILVAAGELWVGFEGAFEDALARYRLRSNNRTWFQLIKNNLPRGLAVNGDGTLIAPLVSRPGTRAVDVYDVKSGQRARTLVESGRLEAIAGDGRHVYVSQREPDNGKIYLCTFRDCTHTIATLASRPLALAVSPLDGNLYASTAGKSSVEVYDPRTGNLVMRIAMQDFEPGQLAIEP